jgi:predicted  nucleic acid-binding Zn-ribbon protein
MVDIVKEKAPATSPVVIDNPNGKGPDVIASGSGQSLPIASRQFGHVVSPNLGRFPVQELSHVTLASFKGTPNSGENDRPVANDAERLPRVQPSARRPPFEDYVPQYRRPDAKEQASLAQISPPRRSNHLDGLGVAKEQNHGAPQLKVQAPCPGKLSAEQGSGSYQPVTQHLQQDQPAGSIHGNEPRHRMSLPNDTSVSPAHASRQLPRDTAQHRVLREGLAEKKALGKSPYLNLNRPVRDIRQVSDIKTPTPRPSSRSSMHGSNISKKQTRPRPSAMSRLHPSRQGNSGHHDDTPSIRRQDRRNAASRPSPLRESSQQSNESVDIDTVAGNVAQALNSHFGMMRDGWRRKDQEISYLEHNLRKQEERLSNFQRQSEGKSGRIQELEEDRSHLQERLQSANQQLEDRSTRLSELQKKCRTYKEHLNSATTEQQELYKAAKAKCETAIQQMREEEHKRKLLDEQQRRDLQATRERLTQVVKSTVAEYSSKERECEFCSCKQVFFPS